MKFNTMKILKLKIVEFNYRPSFKVLVDKLPPYNENVFKEIICEEHGTFFYSDIDGCITCYAYVKNSSEGFGGRNMKLKIEDGSIREFNGQLWSSADEYECSKVPKHISCAITDEVEVWQKGYTFYAGSISQDLFCSLLLDNLSSLDGRMLKLELLELDGLNLAYQKARSRDFTYPNFEPFDCSIPEKQFEDCKRKLEDKYKLSLKEIRRLLS